MSEVITPQYLQPFKFDVKVRGIKFKSLDTISTHLIVTKRKFSARMATAPARPCCVRFLSGDFLATRNAERVLFIVDRIELARQTRRSLNIYLPEFKPVLFKTARRRPGRTLGSSVVVATIQSLMVDRRYREEFTPFHFDLVSER